MGTGPLYPSNSFRSFQLTPAQPVATLNYGYEVAGCPVFNVAVITGKVQIEVKYSGQFVGLSQSFSDGPYPFAVALSNSYRVGTFEVTNTGLPQAYFLQGGQRWQSIHLLTNGTITFSNLGFKALISKVDVDELPGGFESDNELLNGVWKLGTRAVGAACVEQGTQKAIWEVDGEGTFVPGMRPGLSARAATLKDYTLEFDVKIERAGMGWAVAFPLAYPGQGIQLNIVDTFTILFSVHEQTWYTLKAVLSSGQYLAVIVNDTQIFNASLAGYYIGGSTISTTGSFGFGGWQDQSSYVKNVFAYNTANGSIPYTNSMTDANVVLPEYGVHENYASVCLDGAKRDRLQLQVDWLLSQINSTTGLLSLTGFAFLGPTNGGSAISCALLEALKNVALVATAISDTRSVAKYQAASTSLLAAINKFLWNNELGIYSLSPDSPNDYSVAGLSFCITFGAANTSQASRSLSSLSNLRLGPGYKDSTQVNSSDPTVNISPNTNGFLLAALLSHNATNFSSTTLELITSLWDHCCQTMRLPLVQAGNMSTNHLWGGAPTYILTQYVTGFQQAHEVAGFGYGNWVINPSAGLAMGLKKAGATVVTAFGGSLEVQRQVLGANLLGITIKAPRGTSGAFELGSTLKVLRGSDEYSFTVKLMSVKHVIFGASFGGYSDLEHL
ncbi:hypothetical protein BDZ45DRAFT_687865 [Acephala macrosclerotiorum]|nr:hypothetical protein BDZ45DRAFT_687865 [Acephala macrosclerotiorum]